MDDQSVRVNIMEVSASEAKEFVKPKRRRRGKRRKHKTSIRGEEDGGGGASSCNAAVIESKKKFRKVLIRPVDAPNAPKNTSQFIIDDHYHYDDHYDECHLYINFETPYPLQDSAHSQAYEEALEDIDYEYESMKDMDNSAYYLRDFELSYANMRYEELLRMSRSELVERIETMEGETKQLENEFIECDPNSALEQLQHKLLVLQEENTSLKADNSSLRERAETSKADNTSPEEDKDSPDCGDAQLSEDEEYPGLISKESDEECPGLRRKDSDDEYLGEKCDESSGESEDDHESDEDTRLYSSTESLVNEHLAVTYSQSCDINSNWKKKPENPQKEQTDETGTNNHLMVVDNSLYFPVETLQGAQNNM